MQFLPSTWCSMHRTLIILNIIIFLSKDVWPVEFANLNLQKSYDTVLLISTYSNKYLYAIYRIHWILFNLRTHCTVYVYGVRAVQYGMNDKRMILCSIPHSIILLWLLIICDLICTLIPQQYLSLFKYIYFDESHQASFGIDLHRTHLHTLDLKCLFA